MGEPIGDDRAALVRVKFSPSLAFTGTVIAKVVIGVLLGPGVIRPDSPCDGNLPTEPCPLVALTIVRVITICEYVTSFVDK